MRISGILQKINLGLLFSNIFITEYYILLSKCFVIKSETKLDHDPFSQLINREEIEKYFFPILFILNSLT